MSEDATAAILRHFGVRMIAFPPKVRGEIREAARKALGARHSLDARIGPFIEALELAASCFVATRGRWAKGRRGVRYVNRGHDAPVKSDILGPLSDIENALIALDRAIEQLPTDQAYELDAIIRWQSIHPNEVAQSRDSYVQRIASVAQGGAIDAYFPETLAHPGLDMVIQRLSVATKAVKHRVESAPTPKPKTEGKRNLIEDVVRLYADHIGKPSTNGDIDTPLQRILSAVFEHLNQAEGVTGVARGTIKKLADEAIKGWAECARSKTTTEKNDCFGP